MALTTEKTSEVAAEFGRKSGDTGSPEVQIALLTNRIQQMTQHMQVHKQDFSSRRGLLRMVSRRRRLLDYVKSKNPQMYLDLLQRLGIRK
ncbi:30S ribosomal protein S15 [Botrimarina colliarenosi]|uniref:Small ribosomal subunit protein uS15 n=1 Tax=Botrimarina colliarenosi TaxID=2528001 RepID=A0A5C6AJP8_9BACT|nr:30S ribosomal protein S15 [Botrimarina colliarenosi]TWT99630.1 30S ribosomal protein S15 [Botrimarina colliarenosi]